MASINQLVSEFAHSLGQPNNFALRENIKSLIIHTRNEIIRRSYENHSYIDKILTQRFKVTLIDVLDGDIEQPKDIPQYIEEEETRIDEQFKDSGVTNPTLDQSSHIDLPEANFYKFVEFPDIWFNIQSNYVIDGNGLSFSNNYLDMLIPNYFESNRDEVLSIKFVVLTTTNNVLPFYQTYGVLENDSWERVNVNIQGPIPVGASLYNYIVEIPASVNKESYKYWNFYANNNPNAFYAQNVKVILHIKKKNQDYENWDNLIKENEVVSIKRTAQKVPRPVRLTNNLPFDRVSTVGYKTNREIPFIKETSARFRGNLPGMCAMPCYDYINEYLYFFPPDNRAMMFNKVVIEAAFENPTEIQLNNGEISGWDAEMDNNEWLLSEDMIGQIKDIIYKRDLLDRVRENNEIPNALKVNS